MKERWLAEINDESKTTWKGSPSRKRSFSRIRDGFIQIWSKLQIGTDGASLADDWLKRLLSMSMQTDWSNRNRLSPPVLLFLFLGLGLTACLIVQEVQNAVFILDLSNETPNADNCQTHASLVSVARRDLSRPTLVVCLLLCLAFFQRFHAVRNTPCPTFRTNTMPWNRWFQVKSWNFIIRNITPPMWTTWT